MYLKRISALVTIMTLALILTGCAGAPASETPVTQDQSATAVPVQKTEQAASTTKPAETMKEPATKSMVEQAPAATQKPAAEPTTTRGSFPNAGHRCCHDTANTAPSNGAFPAGGGLDSGAGAGPNAN